VSLLENTSSTTGTLFAGYCIVWGSNWWF